MNLRALVCAAALLLGGCTTLMQQDNGQQRAESNWAAHRAAIEQIKQFSLQGRVASGGTFGITGDLRWRQNADGSFDLRLSGPFGAGAVAIAGTKNLVEVKTGKGSCTTADPEGWIKEKMGWTFPVAGLRWWVLGLPAPHSGAQLELAIDGRPKALTQDGWRLDYGEYQNAGGVLLPRKFEIANSEVKIKVIVDRWNDLPAQE